jgi:alanine dehydrogenase
VGAVLVPGAKAPKLITRDMLKTMKPGSVLVDVAIDYEAVAEAFNLGSTAIDSLL